MILLVFHRNYISLSCTVSDMLSIYQKLKRSRDPNPFGSSLSCIH